jgi:hypothetical protein
MTPNPALAALPQLPPVRELMQRLALSTLWLDNCIFIFNGTTAVLLSDLTQEYEADIMLYDRASRGLTLNLYGIARSLVGAGEQVHMDRLIQHYVLALDFAQLALNSERKRSSLAFGLALLDLHGDRILSGRLRDELPHLFGTRPIQWHRWEHAMREALHSTQ